MATETYFFIDGFAGPSSNLVMSVTSGGTATASSGYTCGTNAAGQFASQVAGTKVASTSFSATVQPDGTVRNGDCFALEDLRSGSYDGGTWNFAMALIGSGATMSGSGRLRMRVFAAKKTQDGQTSKREITTSPIVFSSVSNLLTTTAQNTTATWSFPGATLDAEYWLFECGWAVVTASASASAGCLYRQDATNSKVTTTNFHPAPVRYQGETDVGFSGTTANTAPFNCTQKSGGCIVAWAAWIRGATTTLSSVTDTTGNTYTQVGSTVTTVGGSFGSPGNVAFFVAKNIGAAAIGANTVTATFSDANSVGDFACVYIEGADATNPVVTSASGNGSTGTTVSTASYTVARGNWIGVCGAYNDQQGTTGGIAPYVNVFLPTDFASSLNIREGVGTVTEVASVNQNTGHFAIMAVILAPAAQMIEEISWTANQAVDTYAQVPIVFRVHEEIVSTPPPAALEEGTLLAWRALEDARSAATISDEEAALTAPAAVDEQAGFAFLAAPDTAPPALAASEEIDFATTAEEESRAPSVFADLSPSLPQSPAEDTTAFVSEDGPQAAQPMLDVAPVAAPQGEDAPLAATNSVDDAAQPAQPIVPEPTTLPLPTDEPYAAPLPLAVDEQPPGTIAQSYEPAPVLPPSRTEDAAFTSTATLGVDEAANPTQLFPEPQVTATQWPEDLAAPTGLDETAGAVQLRAADAAPPPAPIDEGVVSLVDEGPGPTAIPTEAPAPAAYASIEDWLGSLPPPPEDASWTIVVAPDGSARLYATSEEFAIFIPPPPIVDEVSGLAPPQPVIPPPWYAVVGEDIAHVTGNNPSRQRIHSVQLVRATITVEEEPLFVGDVTNIVCEIVDQNGAPADPGLVTANVRTPDGVVTAQTVTRTGPGVYQITGYVWTQQFGYFVQFQGTAPFQFNLYQSFSVQASPF